MNRNSSVKENSKNKKRIAGIVAAAIVVTVVVVSVLFSGGRSYKATVEQFINAQFEADAEAILELIPEKYIFYMLDEEGYDDLDECIDEGNEAFQDLLDYIEKNLGEDWKVSYKIVSAKELEEEELDEVKEAYEDFEIKITAAKIVEVEVTIKAGDTENTSSTEIPVMKVGRSWYLDMESLGSIF